MVENERRRLVQTLVLNGLNEVLLVKWIQGHLENKFTGCLGEIQDYSASDASNAAEIVQYLVGLDLKAERLQKVAEFIFVDDLGEDCIEIEFVYHATRTEASRRRRDVQDVESRWVKYEDIPFSRMPADDKLWYPHVLHQPPGHWISGKFVFEEDELIEYEIRRARDNSLICSSSQDSPPTEE